MDEKTNSQKKPSTKKRLTLAELTSLMQNAQLNQQIPPLPPGYPDPNKKEKEEK